MSLWYDFTILKVRGLISISIIVVLKILINICFQKEVKNLYCNGRFFFKSIKTYLEKYWLNENRALFHVYMLDLFNNKVGELDSNGNRYSYYIKSGLGVIYPLPNFILKLILPLSKSKFTILLFMII